MFPSSRYSSGGDYLAGYRDALFEAWQSVDPRAVTKAGDMLHAAIANGHFIYTCGNGGSAAIANHLQCDFLKGAQTDTELRPRVVSLSSHLELITAIANDISYDAVFAYQVRTLGRPGDVLVTISSSGDSQNIVSVIQQAKANGLATIALTGFSGGRSATLADINLHVDASNYGIVEDVHQSLMHILAQYLRQQAMLPDLIPVWIF